MQTEVLLNRVNLSGLVERQQGKFIGVDFVKQDGSIRHLVGRTGVRKYSKGGINKVESPDRPYLTVFDTSANGYRTVNLSTVLAIRADGVSYSLVE